MRLPAVLSLACFGHALPQGSNCATTTTEVIIPTTTLTFLSTYVTTVHATTAEDLGTFTQIVHISSTKTVETLTSTSTLCTATGTLPDPVTSTVYASQSIGDSKREANAIGARQASGCTVTSTFTTTYGVTETYIPASKTSTFTDYTSFTQATVTSTEYSGTAYVVATATATTCAMCGPTANGTRDASTTTVTLDTRCAPTAMTSAYSGFGLEYADDVPLGGATYTTSTSDASQCCQLCTEAESCAASSWDIRTNVCKLEFPTDYDTGDLNCGEGLLAYYDAGPDHPMAPGTGLWVAVVCGNVEYGSAPPDDGS